MSCSLVPALRFPEFSINWSRSQLKKLCTFHDNKRVPLSSDDRKLRRGNYRYFGASGVIDYVDDYIFDGEYILLGEDGANIVTRSTPLAFVVSGKFWVNNHAHVFKAKDSARFLAECLERLNYEKYNTGTAQPKLNADVCKNIWLTIPEAEEQQKIAAFLSKVDEKIALLTEKKDKLTEYKRGVMQQLFNGRFEPSESDPTVTTFIPPTLRFKADDGSEFPDWEEKRLGDYFSNLSTGMTPSRAKPEYFSGNNLWITSGELNFSYIDDTLEKITDRAITDTNLKTYPAGTLFIAITGLEAPGTRGRCAINSAPATTNQSCMAFVETPLIDNRFLLFWYQFFSEALYSKYAQGTKQQSFNNKLVEEIPILAPSLQEQLVIVNFISRLNQKIAFINKEISHAKQWKKGLLQQMFV